jgi:hypothetical protein
MATTKTISKIDKFKEEAYLASWAALDNGENGDSVEMPSYSDRSIQVQGTFASATVAIKGSNDGSNYFQLKDPFGNDVSFTAAGGKQIVECTRYIRPEVSGGGGTTDIQVSLLMIKGG